MDPWQKFEGTNEKKKRKWDFFFILLLFFGLISVSEKSTIFNSFVGV